MKKIHLLPDLRANNNPHAGGIKRIVDAQRQYLPDHGFEFVDDPASAQVVATHAGTPVPADTWQGALRVSHNHGFYWADEGYQGQWTKYQLEDNRNVLRNLHQADVITAPTEWVANAIRRSLWADVHVIPHGIDTNVFLPSDGHDGYVLWNKTRIDPVCEIDSLIELALLNPAQPFVSTQAPVGRNTPNNLQVTGTVDYKQSVEQVRNAAVYLCTSRESFGIGTLEACAAGVPVLGYNWGGQAEILTHKVHGWLATPGDVKGLHEGLAWVLEHQAECAANCIELAKSEKYSWPHIIEQYSGLYNQTINTPVRCSIIIRNYNLLAYLEACILSCLNQKCDGGYEVIILDDCSTDGSWELAQEWAAKDKRVKAVQTPKNLRLAGALNYGVSQARGTYILNIDADNLLPVNTLNLLSGTLDTDRSLDIVYGRVQFVDEALEPIDAYGPDGISAWPPIDFNFQQQLAHKNQIPNSALYRKSIFTKAGGYRIRCQTAEDADFWCRAAISGATAKKVSNMVTLIYRDRDAGMSHSAKADWPWEVWYKGLQPAMTAGVPTNEPTLVSVIIPVGPNHTEIVHDALDSVYKQSFKNWECIVVNDSGRPLERMPSWARILTTGTKGLTGASNARNIGIAAASKQAKVFMPLDADDLLDTEALAHMWKAYKAHGGYVYCDFVNALTMKHVRVANKACEMIEEVLPHPLTGLYPIEAWRQAKFDADIRAGEDWDFVAHITSLGYCGTYVPEPLVQYRVAEGGGRDSFIKNIDEVKASIQSKYGEALTAMACGCKKGGGVSLSPEARVAQRQAEANGSEPASVVESLVLVEMYSGSELNVAYTARPSGRTYLFSSSGRRQRRYVPRSDAEYFVNELGFKFRLVDSDGADADGATSQVPVGVAD